MEIRCYYCRCRLFLFMVTWSDIVGPPRFTTLKSAKAGGRERDYEIGPSGHEEEAKNADNNNHVFPRRQNLRFSSKEPEELKKKKKNKFPINHNGTRAAVRWFGRRV
ncbi:hypothetical protein M569_08456 [Genlisea aurea]|uniref:Uncharacterized protein n=1 Tax=Genlisea aurea TaxID=192259 RepID=S8CNG0_9LAMI|nr:hypothetical protein M569_08456 [Genlisea aurea]